MLRPVIVLALLTTTAYAEETSGLRVSVGPAFSVLSRTTTYASFEGAMDSVDRMTGSGFGPKIEFGAAWKLTPALAVGGMIRVSHQKLDVEYRELGSPERGELTVDASQVGPQATVRLDRFFVRAELGLGSVSSDSDTATYTFHSGGLLGQLSTGAEVGYHTQLGPSTTAQVALGGTLWWVRSNEDGDHGEYIDRGRFVTIGVTASIVFNPSR